MDGAAEPAICRASSQGDLCHTEASDTASLSDSAQELEDFPALRAKSTTNWDVKHTDKRASRDGIDRTLSSVSSLIGSYTAELDAALPSEPWIKQRLTQMETKLEVLLQRMGDDMAVEVEREQQHLMLMQDQVDKQGQNFTRQVAELHKQMERESTRNSCVTSTVRESKDYLAEKIEQQNREIELLRARLGDLEAPFCLKAMKNIADFCWNGCFLSPGRLLLPAQHYEATRKVCYSPVKPRLAE